MEKGGKMLITAQEKLVASMTPRLGQEIHVGPWLKITQQRINQFAEVTGDQQWIHTDPERAQAESTYGTTIAHGYLTLSLLPYLTQSNHADYFTKNYPGMKLRVNYGLNRLRFPAPVVVNSSIRAHTVLKSIEQVRDAVEVVYTISVEIEGGKKPACVAEFVARLYA